MRRRPIFGVLSLAIPLVTLLGAFGALHMPFGGGVYAVIPLLLVGPVTGAMFSIIAIARKEKWIYLNFAGSAVRLVEFWWGVVAVMSAW